MELGRPPAGPIVPCAPTVRPLTGPEPMPCPSASAKNRLARSIVRAIGSCRTVKGSCGGRERGYVAGSERTPKRRPGRPRLEQPSPDYLRRREEIIDAAAQVFRVKGYEAGTLDDVASALDMHPATLYHYIQSKSHLLSLVCARVINVILE